MTYQSTPARTLFTSRLKSRVLKLSLKWCSKKWSRLFILKLTEPLQSCCCPVQKYLPRMAKLAWQLSRYLWRELVNFKTNSRPLFTIIFKLKNDNFKTQDFSPLIPGVLSGVSINLINTPINCLKVKKSRKKRNKKSLFSGYLKTTFFGGVDDLKKDQKAKTLRNRLIMSETDPLNPKRLDFMI